MRKPAGDWERFGAVDPYFGVLAHPKYQARNLDEETRREFFQSGEEEIASIFKTIRRHLIADFEPGRCLDFGCGVGRLTIPLGRLAAEVIGTDISKAMLEEARRNCLKRGAASVRLIESDDRLSGVEGRFNFIVSLITFQHIPTRRGIRYLGRLIDLLNEGGVAVIDVTYRRAASPARKIVSFLRDRLPLFHNIANILKRKPFDYPRMAMNLYNLNQFLHVLQGMGCGQIYLKFTNHGGFQGIRFFIGK